MAKTYAIAIDGPAGAGKSTIAKLLAKKLGYYYVDTGAIYRTVAYFMDVTDEIRTQDISQKASLVSAHGVVREVLLDMQRDVAKVHNVIMDGRDIGTVVLPKADVKIFLTASAEVRAKRRYDELIQRGTPKPYDELLEEIKLRDHNDSTRAAAPLRPAEDAVLVDTTGNSFDESRQMILAIIREKVGA